jgi:hypothetical protein
VAAQDRIVGPCLLFVGIVLDEDGVVVDVISGGRVGILPIYDAGELWCHTVTQNEEHVLSVEIGVHETVRAPKTAIPMVVLLLAKICRDAFLDRVQFEPSSKFAIVSDDVVMFLCFESGKQVSGVVSDEVVRCCNEVECPPSSPGSATGG